MLQQKLIYVTVYLFRLIVVGIVCGITDPGDWNIQIRRPLLVVLYYFYYFRKSLDHRLGNEAAQRLSSKYPL